MIHLDYKTLLETAAQIPSEAEWQAMCKAKVENAPVQNAPQTNTQPVPQQPAQNMGQPQIKEAARDKTAVAPQYPQQQWRTQQQQQGQQQLSGDSLYNASGGTHFGNSDSAGAYLNRQHAQQTLADDRERGALIKEDTTGYRIGPVRTGGQDTVRMDFSDVREGDRLHGTWHSHTKDYSNGYSPRDLKSNRGLGTVAYLSENNALYKNEYGYDKETGRIAAEYYANENNRKQNRITEDEYQRRKADILKRHQERLKTTTPNTNNAVQINPATKHD